MDNFYNIVGQVIGYSLVFAMVLGAVGLCLKALLWVLVLMGVM